MHLAWHTLGLSYMYHSCREMELKCGDDEIVDGRTEKLKHVRQRWTGNTDVSYGKGNVLQQWVVALTVYIFLLNSRPY